ncbi:MAG TPA: hypothetical protein DD641_08660, partial [Deltaproteobacteria bacterium]|nr:hypothetical protein [Deltaproteobacteria bacterium]
MFKNNLHIDMIKIVFCLFIFLSYANQDCLASVITITGPDAPNNGDQYTATGGTPPYTWAISKGSITQGGVVTVSGQCGTAIVTVTDASGN